MPSLLEGNRRSEVFSLYCVFFWFDTKVSVKNVVQANVRAEIQLNDQQQYGVRLYFKLFREIFCLYYEIVAK